MEKQTFEVTEKAGTFVAGKRSPGAGQPIQLTAEQAHFALAAGELRMPSEKKAEEPVKPTDAEPAPNKSAKKG